MEKFYITTPIYYPSTRLHIGHAYTTVAGDVLARYKRNQGYDVFYLTGTDEHGQKIESKAKENNMEPKEYVDDIVDGIQKLWKKLDINYDKFIRTTDDMHMEVVSKIFDKLLEQGDIYLSEYTGLYCKSDETFYTKTQVENMKCPDCGGELEEISEESYFFKCSKYVDQLLEFYDQNPEFLQPDFRLKELINNFIEPGLDDLAVSRTSFKWGIPVRTNPDHVIYVWLDALTNYITSLGYMTDDDSNFEKYWPADVQLIGKEIVRFHAIYWPMILMALDLPQPRKIFSHGWLLMNGDKMSKSKGNVIYPDFLVDNYGSDALRYYLMREVPFGSDGQFTPSSFITRYNTDLVNDLSNLLNRSIAMINKYFDGTVKDTSYTDEYFKGHSELKSETIASFQEYIEDFKFHKALESLWKFISATNKLIDLEEPWVLARDIDLNEKQLGKTLYVLIDSLTHIANMLDPFMPNVSGKILGNLNIKEFNYYPEEYTVSGDPEILYQRLNSEEEIQKINDEMEKTLSLTLGN